MCATKLMWNFVKIQRDFYTIGGIKNFDRKFKGISTLGALICAQKKPFFHMILNSTSKP